ncbi:MAG: M14 family zinc carboxypeptidase, partial [Chthoniobacterales bacterium]
MPLPSPLEALRQRNPHLFSRPNFWRTRLDDIKEIAEEKNTAYPATLLGQSAGGRPIYAFLPSSLKRSLSTATISSAMASDRPESFYDPAARNRSTLVLIGSIHGGETEGIALVMNVIQLLRSGRDFLSEEHDDLCKLIEKVRLILIPCLNPDGRAAAAVDHLNGAELEDLYLVQQGLQADGSLFQGRRVKELQPIPPGHLRFQGGYYNAKGVNLQHDDFFGAKISPENAAIRDLFQREIPDAFLTCHAHGAAAAFLGPDSFLSPGMQR